MNGFTQNLKCDSIQIFSCDFFRLGHYKVYVIPKVFSVYYMFTFSIKTYYFCIFLFAYLFLCIVGFKQKRKNF